VNGFVVMNQYRGRGLGRVMNLKIIVDAAQKLPQGKLTIA
jgi:hypothetical protein